MKLYKTCMLIVALITLSGATFAEEAPIVNPYGKFLQGDGIEIEMAEFTEKNKNGLNDILLKMSGAEAYKEGIDNKIIRYTAVRATTGTDYQAEGGKTRLIVRAPYGSSSYQATMNNKTINVSINDDKSKEVKPLHLLTAWKSSQ